MKPASVFPLSDDRSERRPSCGCVPLPMRVVVIAGSSVAAAAVILAAFAGWPAPPPPSPSTASGAPPSFIAQQTPRPLPELRFEDGAGAAMTLAHFRGRVVLLNLWATWCGPCRTEMPALDRLQAKMAGPDFTVVPLSIDHRGRDAVARFYRDLGLTSLGIYVDRSGEAASAVEASGMPASLLVDRQGRELGRVTGGAPWDDAEMVARIKGYL
jgi:thiol-disulfide isomerase/thioredoxin